MEEQQAPPRSFRRWRRGGGAPQPQPLLARLSLFGSKNAGEKCPDGPMLSKTEFVEKVRQSNQACHEGDFRKAIVLYGKALAVDPQNCILYSNRSAAYMKTQQYAEALDDAIKARLLNPKWPKGAPLWEDHGSNFGDDYLYNAIHVCGTLQSSTGNPLHMLSRFTFMRGGCSEYYRKAKSIHFPENGAPHFTLP